MLEIISNGEMWPQGSCLSTFTCFTLCFPLLISSAIPWHLHYLLLCNKLLSKKWLNDKYLFSHSFSKSETHRKLGASGLISQITWHFRYQSGLQSSEGLTKAKRSAFKEAHWLIASKLVLAFGRRPQFLATWTL